MNQQLCYVDAYARSIEARVLAVDSTGAAPLVTLDRTVFSASSVRSTSLRIRCAIA
jgi:hypothetical protein